MRWHRSWTCAPQQRFANQDILHLKSSARFSSAFPSSSSTAGQYEYMPLAGQQIRLLTSFPGSFDDDIRLNVVPVTLLEDEPPKYYALSYAWGSTERCDTVYVVTSEGQNPLPVTQNLHSAPRHLRHTTQIFTLWADAICINQDDFEERSA